MKLNVVLGAAVVAGAITGAGSSWAGDGPAPAAAGPAAKAHQEHKPAPTKELGKDSKSAKADSEAVGKPAKETPADVKKTIPAKPGVDGAKSALEAKPDAGRPTEPPGAAVARDAYKQLLEERKAARAAALAGKTDEEARKAAQEVDARFADKLRESRGKLAAAASTPLSAEARAARDQRLEKLTEKERSERIERRKKSLDALEKAYGKKLQSGWFNEELRRHAWRIARLERLAAIAEASEKPELVARIQELRAKEDKHHAERMNKLEKTVPPASAAPVAAQPAKPTPPAAQPAQPAAQAAPPAAPLANQPATTNPSANQGEQK